MYTVPAHCHIYYHRLVELPQNMSCKQVIDLWQLFLDELLDFYVPSLISSVEKEKQKDIRETRTHLKILLCQLHHICIFMNVILTNATFGAIFQHHTTSQTIEKLKEMMESSYIKVVSPLLVLCPQLSDRKVRKLLCFVITRRQCRTFC